MKKIAIIGLFMLFAFSGFAQISASGKPLSWSLINKEDLKLVHTYPLPSFNKALYLSDDEEHNLDKTGVFRSAIKQSLDITIANSGTWKTLPNGDRIWLLHITCDEAESIGLTFQNLEIPRGGRLFISDKNGGEYLGAFTNKNHDLSRIMTTAPILTNAITVEYFEPFTSRGEGWFKISNAALGYRDIDPLLRDDQSNSTCNENVLCFEETFSESVSSTVLIGVDNGTRWCTGVMVNNTLNNGKPYLLTSSQNFIGDPASWIFVFNHESKTCTPSGRSSMKQSISGAHIIIDGSEDGYLLLELNHAPLPSWKVYYAGWDNSDRTPDYTSSIHHPGGDVKKISIKMESPVKLEMENLELWSVSNWEIGTTEKGTSGAPMFDEKGKLIGIFVGGEARCDNDSKDYFLRFSPSWQEIRNTLDPAGTESQEINGLYAIRENVDVEAIDDGTLIYPNPSNGRFTMVNKTSSKIWSVAVYSLMGKKLKEIDTPNPRFDLTDLSPGTYILNINMSDRIIQKKLIIR